MQINAAPGIHRVEDAYTTWYLLEDEGGRTTIVDAGVPDSWDSLGSALHAIGRGWGDVEAVVLTHAHFDHIGFAERAPYTARTGPRLVARAATVDTARALGALDGLAATGARTVLCGHGEPWTDGVEAAVVRARAEGAAGSHWSPRRPERPGRSRQPSDLGGPGALIHPDVPSDDDLTSPAGRHAVPACVPEHLHRLVPGGTGGGAA